jgi:serine-type D-Ala-D-Ala endopeptidase (penicillin-binding protein 7)
MKLRLATVFIGLICLAVSAQAAPPAAPAAAGAATSTLDVSKLKLASASVLVYDAQADAPIYAKSADNVTPIASVTKLMTAMVVLDADQSLDETISVGIEDIDLLKGSHSRLGLGSELTRREMLRLALMASENRAASSLARHYPGGTEACVEAMNRKAMLLGMTHTHFDDPTGLSSSNVSTASDLSRMVRAAAEYEAIRTYTTTASHYVEVQPSGKLLGYNNTNSLVRAGQWDITVSKTGFIREAGKCLVMLVNIASRPVVIVLLDSYGKLTRIGDANRVKHWLETGETLPAFKAIPRTTTKTRRVSGTLSPTSGKASVPARTKSTS